MLDIPKIKVDDIIEVEGRRFRLVGFAFPSNVPARLEFVPLDEEMEQHRTELGNDAGSRGN